MNNNTISSTEFYRLMDGIARAVIAVSYSYTQIEPTTDWVETVTRNITEEYLNELGITEVEIEDDDEEFDIPDDVDETNYDPYAGCDIYEVDEVW